MSDEPFLTLAGSAEAETRVRGSTFLAVAAPTATEGDARTVLAARERADFDATHHCSAWRLRNGIWRANDGGEPSGSAGAPILAAIDGAELVDCVVVVTRYYGGTKLGVGGLIRAYGDAAALALEGAPRRTGVPARRLRVCYPYDQTAVVMRVLERTSAAGVEHGYTGSGGETRFSVPETLVARVREELREASSGTLSPEELGPEVLYRGGGDTGMHA